MLKLNLLITILFFGTSWSQEPEVTKIKPEVFRLLHSKGYFRDTQKDSLTNLFHVYKERNNKSKSLENIFYRVEFDYFKNGIVSRHWELMIYDKGIILYIDLSTYKKFINSYKDFLFYAKTNKLCREEIRHYSGLIINFFYLYNKKYSNRLTKPAVYDLCRYKKIINSKYTPGEVKEIINNKFDSYTEDLHFRKLHFSKEIIGDVEKGLYIADPSLKSVFFIIDNEIEYLNFDTYKLSVESIVKVLDFCEENDMCYLEIRYNIDKFFDLINVRACFMN